MARLEKAVITLVELFNEYADCDGYICKEDFKDMLDREILNVQVKDNVSEEALDALLHDMDKDKDGYYSINEFTTCVAHVTRYVYQVDKVL